MQILLIEDVMFSKKLIEGQIKTLGHEVIAVSSGYEALDILQSHQSIGLVVCDLFLSDLSGFQVFQETENIPRYRKSSKIPPPFVLLTSSNNPQDLRNAEAMGFVAALNKPLDVSRLQEVITALGDGSAFQLANQKKGKILLVDSLGNISRIMQEIFAGSGYTILHAASKEECLSCLAEYRNIDLIISDLELNDTNAINLLKHCEEVQKESLAKGLARNQAPFVLMTESQNMDLLQIAYLSNFSDIILPPLDKNVIKQKLNRIFLLEGNKKQSPKSILVVDDLHFQTVITSILLKQTTSFKAEAYNILIAESGEDALEILRTDTSIQLVVIDYYLTDMNAIEVYTRTKQIFQKSQQMSGQEDKIPAFLLMTFCDDKNILNDAIAAGFKAVISKPLELVAFSRLVSSCLELADTLQQIS